MSDMMNRETVLSVEDLTINFRTINGMVKAVRGISFDLKRGETVAIVGESGSGMTSMILAITVRGWVGCARIVRTQFLRYRGREYVMAAQTMGVPDRALIFRHILPNSIGPLITRTMVNLPSAIFTESFLAFIGLGLAPPEPSIGTMLSAGQKVLLQYPHLTLFPALVISALMICFQLFGNGLRDALDPTQRGQE